MKATKFRVAIEFGNIQNLVEWVAEGKEFGYIPQRAEICLMDSGDTGAEVEEYILKSPDGRRVLKVETITTTKISHVPNE